MEEQALGGQLLSGCWPLPWMFPRHLQEQPRQPLGLCSPGEWSLPPSLPHQRPNSLPPVGPVALLLEGWPLGGERRLAKLGSWQARRSGPESRSRCRPPWPVPKWACHGPRAAPLLPGQSDLCPHPHLHGDWGSLSVWVPLVGLGWSPCQDGGVPAKGRAGRSLQGQGLRLWPVSEAGQCRGSLQSESAVERTRGSRSVLLLTATLAACETNCDGLFCTRGRHSSIPHGAHILTPQSCSCSHLWPLVATGTSQTGQRSLRGRSSWILGWPHVTAGVVVAGAAQNDRSGFFREPWEASAPPPGHTSGPSSAG